VNCSHPDTKTTLEGMAVPMLPPDQISALEDSPLDMALVYGKVVVV
jgi:hypothetical protein